MLYNPDLEKTKLEFDRASGGMRSPQITTLSEGDVLFRFGSTKNLQTGATIPSDQWARGAWWIQEGDYRKVIQNFQAGKLGLGTVGRMEAIKDSLNLAHAFVRAQALDPAAARHKRRLRFSQCATHFNHRVVILTHRLSLQLNN